MKNFKLTKTTVGLAVALVLCISLLIVTVWFGISIQNRPQDLTSEVVATTTVTTTSELTTTQVSAVIPAAAEEIIPALDENTAELIEEFPVEEEYSEEEYYGEEYSEKEYYEESYDYEPYDNWDWSDDVLTPTKGVNYGPTGKETYYNLPMGGVISIMNDSGYDYEYWERDDGVKMYGDYVIVAADLDVFPRGSVVETSLGQGLVCDTGGMTGTWLDIATNW